MTPTLLEVPSVGKGGTTALGPTRQLCHPGVRLSGSNGPLGGSGYDDLRPPTWGSESPCLGPCALLLCPGFSWGVSFFGLLVYSLHDGDQAIPPGAWPRRLQGP